MSFVQRMGAVATAEDLDSLMNEIRARGSRKWTLEMARGRVPVRLWPALAVHFGQDGIIRPPEKAIAESAPPVPWSIVAELNSLHDRLLSARTALRPALAEMISEATEDDDVEALSVTDVPSRALPSVSLGPLSTDLPPAYASHRFDEGWCLDCGVSEEAVREQRWKCMPEPAISPQSKGHVFGSGNRCSRCGARRDLASRMACR